MSAAIDEFDEMVDFVAENWPTCKTWERVILRSWLEYWRGFCLLGVARDKTGKIVGMGVARPVASVEQATNDRYHFCDAGDFIYVDMAAYSTQAAKRALFGDILRLIGRRKFIAFRRGKDRAHIWKFAEFEKKYWRN